MKYLLTYYFVNNSQMFLHLKVKSKELRLPCMTLFVQYAYTISPSSAAVERVFSLLKASFGSLQNLALEDYIQTSLMYQYNNR